MSRGGRAFAVGLLFTMLLWGSFPTGTEGATACNESSTCNIYYSLSPICFSGKLKLREEPTSR